MSPRKVDEFTWDLVHIYYLDPSVEKYLPSIMYSNLSLVSV